MVEDKPGEKQDSKERKRRRQKNATLNAQIGQAKLVFITLRIVNETQMRNKLQCVCSVFLPFFALAYLLRLSFLSSASTVRICVSLCSHENVQLESRAFKHVTMHYCSPMQHILSSEVT